MRALFIFHIMKDCTIIALFLWIMIAMAIMIAMTIMRAMAICLPDRQPQVLIGNGNDNDSDNDA